MQNVMIVLFTDEDATYKAFTELKTRTGRSTVLEVALGKNTGGSFVLKDAYRAADPGDADDSWLNGGLIGTLVGVLGGPVGMLMGAGVGMMAGGMMAAEDDFEEAASEDSVIQQVAGQMKEDHLALIVIADEEDDGELDTFFDQFGVLSTIRRPVAAVLEEIYQAQEAEAELRRQARAKMREEKKAEWKQKAAEAEGKIKKDFEDLKAKLKKT